MEKEFRFAIMGAGKIAVRFCHAVSLLENTKVAAVASKSLERAQAFAKENGVAAAYGDYKAMLEAEKLDCVYIAATTDAHYKLAMLCLEHGVPVLCEKAFVTNSREAEEIFALAKEKNLFVMEAMWSRFLPAVNKAREWLNTGRIGAPVYGSNTIGFAAAKDPNNRFYNKALGGGAAYDITVYTYELMTYMLDWPVEVLEATAIFGETGVDVTDHVTLRFEKKDAAGNTEGSMLADCITTILASAEQKMMILGEKGKIVLPNAHHTAEAFLYGADGTLTEHFQDEVTEDGFTYEIQEAMDCIRAGRIESPIVPHSLTLDCARLFDRLMAGH